MNFTCKLPIQGSDVIGILNTEWGEHEVTFLLLHDNKAWSGQFQITGNTDITELLEHLSINQEKYLEETKAAVTTHGGAESFIYSIGEEKFSWKKKIRKNMTVKFGYVKISEIPIFSIFERIIDNILHSLIDTSSKLDEVGKGKEVLEKENLILKTKLDNLIEKRNEMERTLYSQFLQVLNEKKKKICELQQKLEPPDNQMNNSDEYQSDNDHFDSETEIDSDEELNNPALAASPRRKELSGPKNSSCVDSFKKSKLAEKHVAVAGPSGTCIKKQNDLKDKARIQSTRKCKMPTLKSKAKDQVANVTNSSEEDAFMFPKRSRKTSKTIKPIIEYESDDDMDDETREGGNVKANNNNLDYDVKEEAIDNIYEESVTTKPAFNEDCKNHIEEETEKQLTRDKQPGTFKNSHRSAGVSSSVLDVLNNLME